MVLLNLRPKIGKRTDEALSLWHGTSFASDLFVTCLLQPVLVVAGPPFVVATAAVAAVARGARICSQVAKSWGSLRRVFLPVFGFHPKTLIEIAMVLSTNSVSFPSNSHVSATFSILLRFGESWNPTNCEKFKADGSQMGRTNLDKSVW